MTKAELTRQVAEELAVPQAEVARVLDTTIEKVLIGLRDDAEVKLEPLGRFHTQRQNARTARNPQTGMPMTVAAKTVAKFKPAKRLKEAVAAR